MTYGTHTTNAGKSYERTYPTAKLSDGRTIMIGTYGWAILEGDGQARSDEIRNEAWRIQTEWLATERLRPSINGVRADLPACVQR